MNAIAWPVVTTFGELKAAMRAGFELVQKPDVIMFALKHAGQYSTPDKLRQDVAVRATQTGFVAFSGKLEDGGRLYKLTTRAGADQSATTTTGTQR